MLSARHVENKTTISNYADSRENAIVKKDGKRLAITGQCISYLKEKFSAKNFITEQSKRWLLALLKLNTELEDSQFEKKYARLSQKYPQYTVITQYNASSYGSKILHMFLGDSNDDLERIKAIIRFIQRGLAGKNGEQASLFGTNQIGQQQICQLVYEERIQFFKRNYLSATDDNPEYKKDKAIFTQLTNFISNLGYKPQIPSTEILVNYKDNDNHLWKLYLNCNPESAILERHELKYKLSAPNINGHECYSVIYNACNELNIDQAAVIFIQDPILEQNEQVLNPVVGAQIKKFLIKYNEFLEKQKIINEKLQEIEKIRQFSGCLELFDFVQNFNLTMQNINSKYPRLLFSLQGVKILLAVQEIKNITYNEKINLKELGLGLLSQVPMEETQEIGVFIQKIKQLVQDGKRSGLNEIKLAISDFIKNAEVVLRAQKDRNQVMTNNFMWNQDIFETRIKNLLSLRQVIDIIEAGWKKETFPSLQDQEAWENIKKNARDSVEKLSVPITAAEMNENIKHTIDKIAEDFNLCAKLEDSHESLMVKSFDDWLIVFYRQHPHLPAKIITAMPLNEIILSETQEYSDWKTENPENANYEGLKNEFHGITISNIQQLLWYEFDKNFKIDKILNHESFNFFLKAFLLAKSRYLELYLDGELKPGESNRLTQKLAESIAGFCQRTEYDMLNDERLREIRLIIAKQIEAR